MWSAVYIPGNELSIVCIFIYPLFVPGDDIRWFQKFGDECNDLIKTVLNVVSKPVSECQKRSNERLEESVRMK